MSESIKQTADFLRSLRTNGRYASSVEDLTKNIPKSIKNIRKDLDRLRIKGDIINLRRGYYYRVKALSHCLLEIHTCSLLYLDNYFV